MTVIDLEANPPRVIDKVVIGDSPEGFAISPTGKLAVALLLNGNDAAKNAWFYNRNGKVVALKIDGKKVTRSNEVEVRGLPEGLVFSNDGRYIYVGNYLDRDISPFCASRAIKSSTPENRWRYPVSPRRCGVARASADGRFSSHAPIRTRPSRASTATPAGNTIDQRAAVSARCSRRRMTAVGRLRPIRASTLSTGC